jgi:coenzyme F420-0:L-glutamate ligase/coenzyme F420-1:gamma-L-glutamate ligase
MTGPEPPEVRVIPVTGLPEIRPGDDLAALIAGAAPWLRPGDVLVVTSKIVAKAEGRLVDLPEDEQERAAGREAAIVAETARVVARRGPIRIVQTHHGFVMAAAGVDASNVEADRLVLLPKDPDASARALRAALRERHGVRVAVVVSDTMGRAWRTGQTDVAVGAAGIAPVRDHRGEVDPYGNRLEVTEIAVVDELAGAGELVKGKCAGVPVAAVRGYAGLTGDEPDGPGVAALIRNAAEDLFALGTAEARAAGLREAARLPDTAHTPAAPAPPGAVAAIAAGVTAAIAAVAGAVAPGTRFAPVSGVRGHTVEVHLDAPANGTDPAALIRLGADVHRLRAALTAEGLDSAVLAVTGGTPAAVIAVQPPRPR